MLLDPSPRRATVRDDEHRPDPGGTPTSSSRHRIREPDLPIEWRQHPLDVGDDRLHLDDQERGGQSVPRHDIDRSTLAADIERGLGHYLPSGAPQEREELLGDLSVVGIEEGDPPLRRASRGGPRGERRAPPQSVPGCRGGPVRRHHVRLARSAIGRHRLGRRDPPGASRVAYEWLEQFARSGPPPCGHRACRRFAADHLG